MKTTLMRLASISAVAFALIAFSSCKVDEASPGIDSILAEITDSASSSMMTHLTSVSESKGNFTEDFKDGFKEGYIAGIQEAAKLKAAALAATTCDENCDCDHCDHHDSGDIVYTAPGKDSASVPSYGYSTSPETTSTVYEIKTAPSFATPQPTRSRAVQ